MEKVKRRLLLGSQNSTEDEIFTEMNVFLSARQLHVGMLASH